MSTSITQLLPEDVYDGLLAASPAASTLNPYITSSTVTVGYIPYTGATANININSKTFTINAGGTVNGYIDMIRAIDNVPVPSVAKTLRISSGPDGELIFRSKSALNTDGFERVFFGALTSDQFYTLQDASGTLAFLSDLTTGYVPYTGAINDVNLGAFTLSAGSATGTGILNVGPSTLLKSQFNLAAGVAPTTPNDGDYYYTTTDGVTLNVSGSNNISTWTNGVQKLNLYLDTSVGSSAVSCQLVTATNTAIGIYTNSNAGLNLVLDPLGGVSVGTGNRSIPKLTVGGNASNISWGINGMQYRGLGTFTYTDTSAGGTRSITAINSFGASILASSNASTYTDVFNVYIRSTTAGALTTITNNWALGTDGNVKITGSGATVATTALRIENSAATGIITVTNDGAMNLGGTSAVAIAIANLQTAGSLVGGAVMTTGTITFGGASQTGTMTFGRSTVASTLIIAGGTGATTLQLANAQTAGSVSIGAAMTTGTITIGGTGAQTGTITIAGGTGAQTISIASVSGVKTINLGTGTGVTTIRIGTGAAANPITIGGAASLIGLYGVAAIVRPTTGIATAAFGVVAGVTVTDTSTFGGYKIGQIAQALINLGLLT